ncbi:MAG: hypothetical protein EOO05_09030 [Chitinophagaceae bacterium]|nr:MAG: hypothetical protein EOO05_09030 [Chitinophagaceae bacterium]
MKITHVVALMLVMFLAACSKDKKEIEPGLRLSIDGKEIIFSDFTVAEYDSTGGIHYLRVGGADQVLKPNMVGLGLTQEEPITARPYIHPDPNNDFYVTLDFVPAGEDGTNPYLAGLDGTDPMSMTITSLTATRVQGTFQGTLRRGTNDTKVISGGSFNLELR